MRNVTLISIALFLQTLTALIAFTGFLAVFREYFRRRQSHLLAYSAGLFLMAVAYTGLFSGKMLGAFEASATSLWLYNSFQYFYAVAMTAFAIGFTLLYVPQRFRRGFVAVIIAILAVCLYSLSSLRSTGILSAYGFKLPTVGVSAYLLYFLTSLAAIGLHLYAFMIRSGNGLVSKVERTFGIAGLIFAAAYAARLLLFVWDYFPLVAVNTAFQLVGIFPITLAAIAKGNPDQVIAGRPAMFIQKRLLYKAAGFNALLFWILSFFLILVTSTYFISAAVESRKTGLRKDVHFFSKSFAASGVQLLAETASLANLPNLPSAIGKPVESLPLAAREFITRGDRLRILRIVDNDGVVVFSSYSNLEVGTLLDSRAMRKALDGKKVSATEHEDAAQIWALRAAAPIRLPDQTVGGVIVTTDLSAALDFSDYTSIAPVNASGYGYVSPTGETAFSMGDQIDELAKRSIAGALGLSLSSTVKLPDSDDIVFTEHAYASDGDLNGYFYAILRDSQVTRYAFRVMSIVLLVLYLALGLVVTVLVFAMSMVLRPIKELRAATSRVERDDYDIHVRYSNPDEVGELASAFNRMSATIEDRTVRLRQSVKEQQDFLEHSVRDMRVPVNVFRWTLELMRFGDTGRMTRQQQEFLEQMHQTNERLSRLLMKLRDVALLDQGRYPLSMQRFSIEDVLDEVSGELAVEIRQRNLALHWKRPEPSFPFAHGDRASVKKVVYNLLSNAVKYNQNNGHIELSVALSDTLGPSGKAVKCLKVSVEDSGKGVADMDKNLVFSRFFRAKDVAHDEVEGSGLGLHISKRMIELNGGEMWFDSEEGKGSLFRFTVPLEKTSKKV